jgi:hypothetical protein
MRLAIFGATVDGKRQARLLSNSGLTYSLVRPPRLTQGPATGLIRHGANLRLSPASFISRADLAAFMLRVAVSGDYAHAAPMAAGGRNGA